MFKGFRIKDKKPGINAAFNGTTSFPNRPMAVDNTAS